MRRQPGALASGAVLVSNRRLSGERPSGLVQNLEVGLGRLVIKERLLSFDPPSRSTWPSFGIPR